MLALLYFSAYLAITSVYQNSTSFDPVAEVRQNKKFAKEIQKKNSFACEVSSVLITGVQHTFYYGDLPRSVQRRRRPSKQV